MGKNKNERHPMNNICPYCCGEMRPMIDLGNGKTSPVFGILVGMKCCICGTESPKVWATKEMLDGEAILDAIVKDMSFEGIFVDESGGDNG